MRRAAYYNEFDKKAAAWIRELIKKGYIADGDVDERSIKDVKPDDLRGYSQCHFFAGIGGWSYALRLAGVPDDFQVWTGSCPCQPFSVAGKQLGILDERHLWPAFRDLIRERRPPICFGEQVASKDAVAWIDGVCNDMEGLGYAIAAARLNALPFTEHERKRIYFVAANANGIRISRLVTTCGFVQARQRGARGKEDLQSIIDRPFEHGSGWSKPLLRAGDDGISERVVGLRGAGNAIVPQVAATFIQASLEAMQ